MRHRRLIPMLLAMALLCSSCTPQTEESQGGYQLYFTAAGSHGPALECQPYGGPQGAGPGELLTALLTGPTKEGLVTPFPRGVTLRSWSWDPEKKGNLQVRLSEQYSGLADVSLTLADYCIVLTLSQLDGVESVEILSSGHATSYRSHQVLTAGEAVLREAD